ncbi:FUSC family protein [Brevibacterium litoralis]|uniref:FUSC family protein n=1 Tax=Brevibacterium litoralis TaxID=3138935 RepID=UPI0032EF8347
MAETTTAQGDRDREPDVTPPRSRRRTPLRRSLVLTGNRLRMGIRRVRTALPQILQIVLGATFAYSFCHWVLGHEYPFLAAVAAAVGTGVTVEKRVRRALEFGLGASFGVFMGELMLHTFGGGIWQLSVIMLVAMVLGQLINSGVLFTMQMGIQAIYVITVPPGLAAGPFDRTIDALIGASVALLMALFVPRDARKAPRAHASTLLQEIAEVLDMCARALRTADREVAGDALDRARDSQDLVDSWRSSIGVSLEAARINARGRRYAREITRLADAVEYADRAMRLVRVICRRADGIVATGIERPQVADMLTGLARGADGLREALSAGDGAQPAEDVLAQVAADLEPRRQDLLDFNDEALVMLLRPLAVDLMQAGGYSEQQAQDALPPLPRPVSFTDLLDAVAEAPSEEGTPPDPATAGGTGEDGDDQGTDNSPR